MSTILITGSAAGLGAAIAAELNADGHKVIDFDIANGNDVRSPMSTFGAVPYPLDILINNAAVNTADWLENFPEDDWDRVMDVNAKGIYMMSRWALPSLRTAHGTILNIVSNAAHVPMRTSLAYNASKGAAHIMTLQMARELGPSRHNITVFGVAPNKLQGTPMSAGIERQITANRGWTPEFAAEYQRAALVAGEETDPHECARFIAYLLKSKRHHKFLAGCVLPYGA